MRASIVLLAAPTCFPRARRSAAQKPRLPQSGGDRGPCRSETCRGRAFYADRTRHVPVLATGRSSTSRAVGPLPTDLAGSARGRRHPRRRARSAPPCSVSRGPPDLKGVLLGKGV